MINLPIKIDIEPDSAKQTSELYHFYIIDDDPDTPHQRFENTAQPWIAKLEKDKEYVYYIHGRFVGAAKVKVTVGSVSKEYVPHGDGFIKKIGHIHI